MRRTFTIFPPDGKSETDIALMFAMVRDAAKIQDHADAKAKTRLMVKQAQKYPTEMHQETMLESYRNKMDPSLRVPSHILLQMGTEIKASSCPIC